MPDVISLLQARFASALSSAFGESNADVDPQIAPANNPRFGDYQANLAMALAKQLGRKPRDVAQRLVEALELDDICARVDIAGPGFINLFLADAFLDAQTQQLAQDVELGVTPAKTPQTVVIDYSSPNVAKEMHVGHLRSTVIGDCLARVLEKLGHRVIRQNHLGDWGTQFGMLIEHLIESVPEERRSAEDYSIGDLNDFYQQAKRKFDADPDFAQRSRERVVKLQSGDAESKQLWESLRIESLEHFDQAYDSLGVALTDDDVCSESFYNDQLSGVIAELDRLGLLQTSDGAKVVYPEGFTNQDDEPLGMIVRKSDGGFLYATTDLAAGRHRIDQLHADRIVYVTDARQAQHFAMVFATLRKAGWAPEHVELDYVPFGMVLGKDRRPFKTRTGGTVKLADLIGEAVERAATVIGEKNPAIESQERQQIAQAVGVGALKYADLSGDRIKDYAFDWERMLSFEGNTAPYLQNAYVRIRSIFRKGEINIDSLHDRPVLVREQAERQLALKLLQFASVAAVVADRLEPHRLCTYLYELATAYHHFYEHCPVLKADDLAQRDSRLRLSDLAARVLSVGLDLLGIQAIDRM